MTVLSTDSTAGPFVGNGVQTAFPFELRIFTDEDVLATETDTDGNVTTLVLGSDYTIAVNADQSNNPGGTLNMLAALTTDYELNITTQLEVTQESTLTNAGGFYPKVVENMADKLTILLKQEGVAGRRTVRAPFPETLTELPSAPDRANTILAFDSDGDATVLVPATGSAADVLTQLADTTTAARGDAKIGWSAISSIIDGTLTRHATLAAAITAVGATRAEIVVRDDITVPSNATIPATAVLRVENKAILTLSAAVTLTINGKFTCGPVQCFTGAGKPLFARDSITAVLPQWWGAKGDAAADGTSGTDCTAAMTAAIAASCLNGIGDVSIHPVRLGAGNWLTGNLLYPPAFRLAGEGKHISNFVAKPGTVGKWMTDSGSASKITMTGFAMYAHGEAGITHGLQLGRNGTAFGTEGLLHDIWIRDVTAAGAYGLDVLGDVGEYGAITVQACARNIRIGGSVNHADKLVSMQPVEVGADLSYCTVMGLHIEAPGNSCVPLMLTRNSEIMGLSISLADATTISHLVELDAGTLQWSIENLHLFFGSTPAGVTVTNGNMKRADGTYFGGNATAGSVDGNGSYSSREAGQVPQCFTLRIVNTAGTLQHRIATTSGNTSNFASKVNGASATLANTPTGADASTAMSAGGKIGSASPSIFWFDTPAQKEADGLYNLGTVVTTTGDALTAEALVASININGVTRSRLGIQFYLNGAAYALTTANIAAGEIVQVSFLGHLA